jgi:hypothetical protein
MNHMKTDEIKVRLSPQQRESIEALVKLSPTIIHGRVRRDAISAVVLKAYTQNASQERKDEESSIEVKHID